MKTINIFLSFAFLLNIYLLLTGNNTLKDKSFGNNDSKLKPKNRIIRVDGDHGRLSHTIHDTIVIDYMEDGVYFDDVDVNEYIKDDHRSACL